MFLCPAFLVFCAASFVFAAQHYAYQLVQRFKLVARFFATRCRQYAVNWLQDQNVS